MVTIFDVDAQELIDVVKEKLKKIESIKPPEWSKFVKTGVSKERTPMQKDFWFIRAAAILRQLYKMGKPIGVQRLRTKYGGKEKNKSRPAHFVKGSGSIIRKIIQQLESAGFVKKDTIKDRKGRTLTKKGMSFLDKAAAEIFKGKKA